MLYRATASLGNSLVYGSICQRQSSKSAAADGFHPLGLGCGARQMELFYALDLGTVCPCINVLNYG